jgi:hypothetical protein
VQWRRAIAIPAETRTGSHESCPAPLPAAVELARPPILSSATTGGGASCYPFIQIYPDIGVSRYRRQRTNCNCRRVQTSDGVLKRWQSKSHNALGDRRAQRHQSAGGLGGSGSPPTEIGPLLLGAVAFFLAAATGVRSWTARCCGTGRNSSDKDPLGWETLCIASIFATKAVT